jgi:hypothetical protein
MFPDWLKHAPGSTVYRAGINMWLLTATVILAYVRPSHERSTLGERALAELSTPDISSLVSAPDPSRNLDVHNAKSHLSKILIPRARMYCN